jgi:hypothetical protein
VAIEIFTDKYKLVHLLRRPIPKKVSRLGAWEDIMKYLGYLSVLINCGLVAFSSKSVDVVIANLLKINPYLVGGGSFIGVVVLEDSGETYSQQVETDPEKVDSHLIIVRVISFLMIIIFYFFLKFFINAVIVDVPRHLKVLIRRHKRIRNDIRYGSLKEKVRLRF